jgi:hypothetical protein
MDTHISIKTMPGIAMMKVNNGDCDAAICAAKESLLAESSGCGCGLLGGRSAA